MTKNAKLLNTLIKVCLKMAERTGFESARLTRHDQSRPYTPHSTVLNRVADCLPGSQSGKKSGKFPTALSATMPLQRVPE